MICGHKVGFMPSGSYEKQPIAAICESLKNIGYDAVEWHLGFVCPRSHTYSELNEIFHVTEENGLEVSEIVVQQDLIMKDVEKRKDNIEYVKECIEVFASLGIKTINLFTGPIPWNRHPVIIGKDISEGEAWEMVFDAFEQFVTLSEKNKLHLAVENVWGMLCHDFYTARFLIDYFNSPYLGVNYDPSHDILAGNSFIASDTCFAQLLQVIPVIISFFFIIAVLLKRYN
jgi:sugar phosphate isomerase/epimerase